MVTGLSASRGPARVGTYMLVLAGHADLDTESALTRALGEAFADLPAPEAVVVDCAGVGFCSSSGLNALLGARRRAIAAGIAFRLAAPSSQVTRLLQITGTDTVFTVTPDAPPASA
ncbi:STAS domain-containing protein [Streptomyces sp. NPDC001594]|uniref:STAS domain-containing protein n=1 Tax=Streptomyces sp. NPDC001594 TaxID=3364590 RepID=UPI0036C2DB13